MVASAAPCLCLFDVDRTLTGHQRGHNRPDRCPRNTVQQGTTDSSDGGGELALSEVAQQLGATFCGERCYIGVITGGNVSGRTSPEARLLWSAFDALPLGVGPATATSWAEARTIGGVGSATSPLVTLAADGQQKRWVPHILRWYLDTLGVSIADAAVHFFDDQSGNVLGFAGTPWSARQISCASRDGAIGLCGATLDEIVPDRGVRICGDALGTCRGAAHSRVACPSAESPPPPPQPPPPPPPLPLPSPPPPRSLQLPTRAAEPAAAQPPPLPPPPHAPPPLLAPPGGAQGLPHPLAAGPPVPTSDRMLHAGLGLTLLVLALLSAMPLRRGARHAARRGSRVVARSEPQDEATKHRPLRHDGDEDEASADEAPTPAPEAARGVASVEAVTIEPTNSAFSDFEVACDMD